MLFNEKTIIETAKFKFIVKYHGKKSLRDCISETLLELTQFDKSQFANVFGMLYGELNFNFDEYVEKIYTLMENEAKKNLRK